MTDWRNSKNYRQALRQIIRHLEGINDEDLTTAERAILRIAREALEVKR